VYAFDLYTGGGAPSGMFKKKGEHRTVAQMKRSIIKKAKQSIERSM
jgi:hypothetical protein